MEESGKKSVSDAEWIKISDQWAAASAGLLNSDWSVIGIINYVT